jgi:hypothetical protein
MAAAIKITRLRPVPATSRSASLRNEYQRRQLKREVELKRMEAPWLSRYRLKFSQ